MNIFKKINFKMILILSILLFIYTTLCAISYASYTSKDISDSVFRLHVLANSDSAEDQNLKYKVRDKLLDYMNSICTNTSNKEEAINIANSHLEDFKTIAKNTIEENGYNYDVTVEIGNFEFPTKTYGDISLPSGYYDALRVKIGEAKVMLGDTVLHTESIYAKKIEVKKDEKKEGFFSKILRWFSSW